MVNEVIDLTASPPSSPNSRILRLLSESASSSKRMIQWKNMKSSLPSSSSCAPNPSFVIEPEDEDEDEEDAPNAFFFRRKSKLGDPWTLQEHEQFLMGLMEFGSGNWEKICEQFVRSKTAKEVESHAKDFFSHVPSMYLQTFMKKKALPSSFCDSIIPYINDLNVIPSTSDSMNPMMMTTNKDMGPPPSTTLTLFPEGSRSSNNINNNNNTCAFGREMMMNMMMDTTMDHHHHHHHAIDMASGDGDVDLELRLG